MLKGIFIHLRKKYEIISTLDSCSDIFRFIDASIRIRSDQKESVSYIAEWNDASRTDVTVKRSSTPHHKIGGQLPLGFLFLDGSDVTLSSLSGSMCTYENSPLKYRSLDQEFLFLLTYLFIPCFASLMSLEYLK